MNDLAIASRIDTEARAASIYAKLQRDKEKRAVIYSKAGGSFKTVKLDAVFETCLVQHPGSIVGVYDDKCRLEWLEDDLRYMLK